MSNNVKRNKEEVFCSFERQNLLRAPITWFGAKDRVVDQIWSRIGEDATNIIEPFLGTGVWLFNRPWGPAKFETGNDADSLILNFHRATQANPRLVARLATDIVHEVEFVHSNRWLFDARERLASALQDRHYYDADIAAQWLWGQMMTIAGFSLKRSSSCFMPRARRIPRYDEVEASLTALSERIRNVRFTCGNAMRLLKSPTNLWGRGLTGILLDPPYRAGTGRSTGLYAGDHAGNDIAVEVRDRAIELGANPKIRIAICGYIEEHDFWIPKSWERYPWCAGGGFANQDKTGSGAGRARAGREMIWFSPHCNKPPLAEQVLNRKRYEKIRGSISFCDVIPLAD